MYLLFPGECKPIQNVVYRSEGQHTLSSARRPRGNLVPSISQRGSNCRKLPLSLLARFKNFVTKRMNAVHEFAFSLLPFVLWFFLLGFKPEGRDHLIFYYCKPLWETFFGEEYKNFIIPHIAFQIHISNLIKTFTLRFP